MLFSSFDGYGEKKMKRIIILLFTIILCFSFLSCGGENTTEENTAGQDEVEQESSEGILFKDNVFENDKVKIEITKYEVIQPGDTTYNENNYMEDRPVIAFWYNATNKTDESIDPISAWLEAGFIAIQDNDPNRINELEVSASPDESFLDTQTETIKNGGTVENCWGYLLDDDTTPVALVSYDRVNDKEYGRQEFTITD